MGRKQHVGNKLGEPEVCLTVASPQSATVLARYGARELFVFPLENLHNLIFPQNKVEKQFTLV